MAFQSKEGENKPTLTIEYSTEVEVGTGLDAFALHFAANDVNVVYPSNSHEKPVSCVAASVSDWMASAFVSTKLNSYTEGLDINSDFVDQTSSRPEGNSGEAIISFGGPVVNPVVKYAENTGVSAVERR
jgi:hypothetical protein